ncbi:hypothetical protein PHISP_01779 [Aspergillus sp. HF37]|nr:hypothetical protein PHISP_01779 [Aspergillus sp. HF37]
MAANNLTMTADSTNRSNIPILTTPEVFPDWILSLRDHIAANYWEHFNPNGPGVKRPTRPEEPQPVPPPRFCDEAISAPLAGSTRLANSPATTMGSEEFMSANQEMQQTRFDNYCMQMSIVSQLDIRYEQYLEQESTIRALIFDSVPRHIMPKFREHHPHPRDVLIRLQQSMSPDPKVMKQKTEEEYDRFIKRRWHKWPYKGPDSWLDEWSKLMKKCQRWAPDRMKWATSFIEVWEDHPDLIYLIVWIQLLIREDRLETISMEVLSNELRTVWERKKRQQSYRNGPRTTRAVFTSTFDGLGPEDDLEEGQPGLQQEEAALPRKSTKKGHKRSNQSYHEQQRRKTIKCWFCDGSHRARGCSQALQKPMRNQPAPSDQEKETFRRRIEADPGLVNLAQSYRTIEQLEADLGPKMTSRERPPTSQTASNR